MPRATSAMAAAMRRVLAVTVMAVWPQRWHVSWCAKTWGLRQWQGRASMGLLVEEVGPGWGGEVEGEEGDGPVDVVLLGGFPVLVPVKGGC